MNRTTAITVILGCAIVLAVDAGPSAGLCVGDCNDSGTVSIAEVQRCANIFLGTQDLSACANCDRAGDGSVSIADVESAANSFLDAGTCPGLIPETPTSTPNLTPTVPPTETSTPTTIIDPTPSDVTRSVAGRASVVARGLTAVPSVVTAIVSAVTIGSGGAAETCPGGGTATSTCTGLFGRIEIEADLSRCTLATAAGPLVLDGSVLLSGPGFCPAIFVPIAADIAVTATFKDSTGVDKLMAAADLAATITVLDTGGECFLTAATMSWDGSLTTQDTGEEGMEAQFDNTMVEVLVSQFNEHCVPVLSELTFNRGTTFTEASNGDSFDVTFDDLTLSQDATVVPAEFELNGDIASTCFAGLVTLVTETPLEFSLGNPCPVGGVVSVVSQGVEQEVVYSDTGVGLVPDADGSIEETHPSCLVPELFPLCPL